MTAIVVGVTVLACALVGRDVAVRYIATKRQSDDVMERLKRCEDLAQRAQSVATTAIERRVRS